MKDLSPDQRNTMMIALLQELIVGVNGIKMPEFKVSDTFKLDPDQFREMVASSKYGGVAVGTGQQQTATRVTMANVSMTSANTEYSYTFPANTVSFYMKLRAQDQLFTFAWVTGKMPTSGDGGAYMTTSQNFLQSRPGLELGGKTIYFQSDAASQVMEIESYRM